MLNSMVLFVKNVAMKWKLRLTFLPHSDIYPSETAS